MKQFFRCHAKSMLCTLGTCLVLAGSADAAGVRESHPNLVGGELLGRGFALTLNYERFLNNNIGVGGGVMAIGSSSGVVAVTPLYLSVLTGDTHSLYLSAGAALLSGSGDLHNYTSAWVLQGSVGYQFQSSSGFFVRPLFTINGAAGGDSGFLVWPGMTIGGSF